MRKPSAVTNGFLSFPLAERTMQVVRWHGMPLGLFGQEGMPDDSKFWRFLRRYAIAGRALTLTLKLVALICVPTGLTLWASIGNAPGYVIATIALAGVTLTTWLLLAPSALKLMAEGAQNRFRPRMRIVDRADLLTTKDDDAMFLWVPVRNTGDVDLNSLQMRVAPHAGHDLHHDGLLSALNDLSQETAKRNYSVSAGDVVQLLFAIKTSDDAVGLIPHGAVLPTGNYRFDVTVTSDESASDKRTFRLTINEFGVIFQPA